MSRNILILTGSARKNGNSDRLAQAFAKGAKTAGHMVDIFESAHNKIGGCIACDTCWSKGKPCSFNDGFDQLFPLLEAADMLVMCGPVYWYSFSAHLKTATDKLYAYAVPQCQRKLKIEESALLMCAGDAGTEVFNGVVASYQGIVGYMKWKDKGMLLIPNVYDKGEIDKSDALQRAEEMGRKI